MKIDRRLLLVLLIIATLTFFLVTARFSKYTQAYSESNTNTNNTNSVIYNEI